MIGSSCDLNSHLLIHRSSLNELSHQMAQWGLSKYSQAVLISTPLVLNLYGDQVRHQLRLMRLPLIEVLLPEGEQAKTLSQALICWEKMGAAHIDRRAVVIALGGGAITDLAGFVASCYMRGIDTIYIPTTLMGMIDAAIGGKTAINVANSKNLIGTFYHPQLILIDPDCLSTLPAREKVAGLAEMIKYGIVKDRSLFEDLEEHIEALREGDLTLLEQFIRRSCQIKWEIIHQDPEDKKGIRAHLNYGHTFAHAIENLTHYQVYLHGEAVSIGMNYAARLSYQLGEVEEVTVKRIENLCRRAGLPIDLSTHFSIDHLIEQMKGDKKSILSKINLILLKKIGKVFTVSNVDPHLIRNCFNNLETNPQPMTK